MLRTCNIQDKTIQILNKMDSDNNLKQYRYMVDWYQYTDTKNIDKMQDQIKKIMLFNYSDLRFPHNNDDRYVFFSSCL
jgi:hypothetical protein